MPVQASAGCRAPLSSSAPAPIAETSFRAIIESIIPSLSICNLVGVSRVALSGRFPEGGFDEPEIAAAGAILHDLE